MGRSQLMERTFSINFETEYIEFDYEDPEAENEDELYQSAVDYVLRNIEIQMY